MARNEIALAARARGLSTHLLTRAALERLADAPDVEAFSRALLTLGSAIDPIGEPRDVFAIDRAVTRTANRHLLTLWPWQQHMPGVLDVVAADRDRRNVRALLRGAVQGTPLQERLLSLLPTPSLPQRTLAELARSPSPQAVVTQLRTLGHPFASRLRPLVEPSQVDLFAVDVTLLAAFVERATEATAAADKVLREYVTAVVDIVNAQHALLLAAEPRDVDPARAFVTGGRRVTLATFLIAARARSPQTAMPPLQAALRSTPFAVSLTSIADAGSVDREFLSTALRHLTHAARLDPMCSAATLRVLLLSEAQSRDLRAIAWGASFGIPAAVRKQYLLTPS